MGKLISQLLILLLLYRYYKRMYGEWSSWHLLFAAWNVGMLLAAAVGTASFWEYRSKPAGHSLLYLYYAGIGSTALYTLCCVGVWLMLGSRLSEGWWSRLTLYSQQLWGMALMGACAAEQLSDYEFWWRRQESEPLLWWCRVLQGANTVLLSGAASCLLLVGAVGFFDGTSFEGWWHWAYWQSWDCWGLGHCLAAGVLGAVWVRAYYMSFLLYGTIRDLDTGLIYRGWLRLTSAQRTVVHDVLYPMFIQSWAEWEARGPWYAGDLLHYYELPANWYSYHHYALDWDFAVNEDRFYRYYYFNKRAIRRLAGLFSKYKRLFEFCSENCMTRLYEEEDYG